MSKYETEILQSWRDRSYTLSVELEALKGENLRIKTLAFEFWLELMAQTKERIRAEAVERSQSA